MKYKPLLREHASVFSAAMRIGDVLLVLSAGVLAYLSYFGKTEMPLRYQMALYLGGLLTFIIFSGFGVYKSGRGGGLAYELRQLALAWAIIVVALITLAFLTKTSELYSRAWMGYWTCLAWVGVAGFHATSRFFLRWIRERGFNIRRVVVVGAGELGQNIVAQVQDAPWTGFKVLRLYDDDDALWGKKVYGVKVEGSPNKLPKILQRVNIDEVWLALPLRAEKRVKEILHALRHSMVTVRFVPDVFGFRLLNHALGDVAGIPLVDLHATPMVGVNRALKALEDRALSVVILVLVSPLFLLISIAIKCSSKGPVFFRQQRVGWNGKSFVMLKFRSMPVDLEKDKVTWGNAKEKAATGLGTFLRRSSLDELPQFINVLKGDMSIVGPRPERPIFVEKFKEEIPGYMQKHLVKAGITGWAQINGWRGDTDLNARIEHDLFYIEHWSLGFDLKIIFMTLFKGFIHKNAY